MPPAKNTQTQPVAEVLDLFEQQRKDAKAQFEQRMEEINQGEKALRVALNLNGSGPRPAAVTAVATTTTPTKASKASKARRGKRGRRKASHERSTTSGYRLSVSDDKYQEIIQYLCKHPEGVRQSDLAKSLKLNSGTISVAMQIAKNQGEARHLGKKDRANVWAPTEAIANPNGGKGEGTKTASKKRGRGRLAEAA